MIDKIKNEQGIKRIIMKPTACTLCKIGQDWYHNNLDIQFIPADCYPDYMQVEEFIMSEIDGKPLNIEDVVDNIYNFLMDNYCPQALSVTDYVTDCKSHFSVIVSK